MRKTMFSALALVLAAACTTVSAASAPPLSGSRWSFTTIDGARPTAPRTSLEFLPDRIGANVGCNGMGGAWRQQGSRIMVEGVISTMMYCEGIMEQERAVADLLGASPTFRIARGVLTLTGGGHTATLRRQ